MERSTDATDNADPPLTATKHTSLEGERNEGEEDEAVAPVEATEMGDSGENANDDSISAEAEAVASPSEIGYPGDDTDEEEGEVLDEEEIPHEETPVAEANTSIGLEAEIPSSENKIPGNEKVSEPAEEAAKSDIEPPVDNSNLVSSSDMKAFKVGTTDVTTEENEDMMVEDEDYQREDEAEADGSATTPAKVEEASSVEFHEETSMEVDVEEEQKAEDGASDVATSTEIPTADAAAENGSSTADESSLKELPYSTRGRSTGSASGEEKLERGAAKDVLEDLARPKETPAGVSFLDALSDEERRTRTRFVPEVDGMHSLRKNEVKEDVALARSLPSIASSHGSVQSRAARLAASTGRKKDAMNLDGEELDLAAYDVRTTTIQLSSSEVTIPNDSFVAPDGVIIGETEGTIVLKENTKKETAIQSPSLVDSVTAFNPPRPPESVGAKKKHRVLRWERRPEDIEVDMKNYRRTVQRTRQELKKSEAEYERLETMDAHLRRHFLNQLELLNEEYKRLHDVMQIELQKLMKETDLGVSRTRSKNLTKVSVVMRDVLTILSKNEVTGSSSATEIGVVKPPAPGDCLPGIGGLNAQAFVDWDRSTDIRHLRPAVSWMQVGQKVTTPYGEGTVKSVIAPEIPQARAIDEIEKNSDVDSQKNVANEEARDDFQKTSNREKSVVKLDLNDRHKSISLKEQSKYSSLLPAQVEVNLELGVATFGIDAIKSVESQAHLNDGELGRRWRGMIESALQVGPMIDIQGMSSPQEKSTEMGDDGYRDAMLMDVDPETKGTRVGLDDARSENEIAEASFLPIGSSLIPTKSGRGNFLYNMNITDIEKELQEALYGGCGVLGEKSNPGVTKEIRKWEDDEHEYYSLHASVLQLKNALCRQRRIRVLNERTSISMADRYHRAEELVSEMRSDLKSLKCRLEDELTELGITEEMAEHILSKFYQGHDEEDKGDASTPKRLRRATSVSREMLPGPGGIAKLQEEDPRDSMDDQGTDDLSGDDQEARLPSKKIKTSQ